MSITIISLDNSVAEAIEKNMFQGFNQMSPETQEFIKSCDRYQVDWGMIRLYKDRALVGEGNAYQKDSGEIVIQNLANRELYSALDGIQNRKTVLDRNLSNMGLRAPDCATAYRAVFHATLNAELAWEAARQEYLLWLRDIQKRHERRYDTMPSDVYHYTVNHSARLKSAGDRAEEIDRVAKMPNPFAPGGAAYQEPKP